MGNSVNKGKVQIESNLAEVLREHLIVKLYKEHAGKLYWKGMPDNLLLSLVRDQLHIFLRRQLRKQAFKGTKRN